MTEKEEIQKAIEFAVDKHKDVYRKGRRGQTIPIPSIIHPMAVLALIYKWGAARNTYIVKATLCHDTMEDAGVEIEELVGTIGFDGAAIVKELTFIPVSSDHRAEKEAYMKTFLTKSIDALVIKMADRICNVYDFMDYGDLNYAKKYFHKADDLWAAFNERKKEIITVFGESVAEYIENDIYELEYNQLGISGEVFLG